MNRRIFKRIGVAFLSCMLVAAFAATDGFGQATGAGAQAAKVTSPGGHTALNSKVEKQGKVKILVRVRIDPTASSALSEPEAQERQAAISSAQSAVIADLATAGSQPAGTHQYEYVPYLAMTVDGATLAALLASSNVVSVEEDIPVRAIAGSWNMTLIGSPVLNTAGIDGSGIAVAVLDTGVEKTHPYLSGAVVSEACYSTTNPFYPSTSVCPGEVTDSTATGSAMPYAGVCPAGECDHGTHVSGIVAGRTGVGGSAGVAPKASIIAIQIFTRFDTDVYCGLGGSPCALTFTSDQIKGLERVYALRNTYTIASVNMSLGGGYYSTNCDTDSRKSIIDLLKAAGIATVIASGNEHYCGYISAPACISSAVSVGATDSTDSVADYSNSASILKLLAPGSSIKSSIPHNKYATWNGTSMATPHVAGTWALIRQARPDVSVDNALNALIASGTSVTDTKAGCTTITKPRINLYNAFLTVTLAGNKKGAATSSPGGLACSSKINGCRGFFVFGTTATLTGVAAANSFFDSWTGCTSVGADGTCQVTAGSWTEVIATFNPPPKLTPSPASLNFGTVASTGPFTTKTITVKNTGTSHLDITSVASSTTEFGVTADTCTSTTLAKGGSCTISVSPTGFTTYGTKTATLAIVSTDPKSPATVKLQANAAAPKISVPGSVGFGSVKIGNAPQKTVTVKNTGTSTLTFASVTLRSGTASLAVNSGCTSLAKNATCPITITYTPTDTTSVKDYIDIVTNDPAKGTATVTVTGKGAN